MIFDFKIKGDKKQADKYLTPHKDDGVTVGIHVRQTYMKIICNILHTCRVVDTHYFEESVEMICIKYKADGKDVTVVILINNLGWCKYQDLFQSNAVVLVNSQVSASEFSILRSCYHIILKIGASVGGHPGWARIFMAAI